MSLPTITLTVDGLNRTVSVRNPGGSPKNGVIWIHGGTPAASPGEVFLDHCPSGSDRIDFGPWGLMNDESPPRYVWVSPGAWGFDFTPSIAPSAETDRNFMDALADYIFANYPSIEKLFVVSSSIGALLGWHLYASNKTHAEQVVAYFLGSAGEPTANGYNWPAMDKDPRHCCLWNGTLDNYSQTEVGAKSWGDSTVDLRNAAGYSGTASFVPGGSCCGKSMQKAVNFESGPVKLRRFARVGGGHEWSDCPSDPPPSKEGERAILTFQQWGVWAT
jgi:hypothetical protein